MEKNSQRKGIPKSFCFKPWNEAYAHFNTSGPCCINYKLVKGGFTSYLESQELKELKSSFLKGEKHPSCAVCWDTEAAGMKSVRQGDKNLSRKLNRISISISNKCNFKCMMCNPEDSSAWSNDSTACIIRKMSPFVSDNNSANIDWIIERAKLNKIILTVIGGEPFICDEYLYLIEQIKKYDLFDNIYLVITTNLSDLKYRGVDHLDVLSKFTNVDVFASSDGVG